MIALLVGLPFFFITRAIAATQAVPRRIVLPGDIAFQTTMKDVHGAIMAAITVAYLAGLCGVFVMQSAREADRRLVVAGFGIGETVAARFAVLLAGTLLVLAVSLAVTAISFTPRSWAAFAGGNLIVGVNFAALGALAGVTFGGLGATYVMFFLPMIDIGVLQTPMFGDGNPGGLAALFPGYGPARVVIDGAFSSSLHASGELALAVGWTAVLALAVALALRRSLGVRSSKSIPA